MRNNKLVLLLLAFLLVSCNDTNTNSSLNESGLSESITSSIQEDYSTETIQKIKQAYLDYYQLEETQIVDIKTYYGFYDDCYLVSFDTNRFINGGNTSIANEIIDNIEFEYDCYNSRVFVYNENNFCDLKEAYSKSLISKDTLETIYSKLCANKDICELSDNNIEMILECYKQKYESESVEFIDYYDTIDNGYVVLLKDVNKHEENYTITHEKTSYEFRLSNHEMIYYCTNNDIFKIIECNDFVLEAISKIYNYHNYISFDESLDDELEKQFIRLYTYKRKSYNFPSVINYIDKINNYHVFYAKVSLGMEVPYDKTITISGYEFSCESQFDLYGYYVMYNNSLYSLKEAYDNKVLSDDNIKELYELINT